MKKYLLLLIGLLICIIPIKASAKENKISIYLFRGYSCSHCEEALNYIGKHKDLIPENVEFITYEVWKDANNSDLRYKVAEALEIPEGKQSAVPFFVVGEKYIQGYADASTFTELFGYAEDYLQNGDYKDIVSNIIRDTKISVTKKTLDELYPEPNKMVTIIVFSVFGVIILGFVGMIVFSRK